MKRRLTLCFLSAVLALPLAGGCSSEPDSKPKDDAGEIIVDVGDDIQEDVAEADAEVPPAPEGMEGVELTEIWELLGLQDDVHVVRTESNVPHIYAKNAQDLARVHGFVAARDRYFMMDLSRRLSLGTISGLLGDSALANDVQARMTGMEHVAKTMLAAANEETLAVLTAYAEGVNAYVEHVGQGLLPAPSEVDLAASLLGYTNKADMMKPFSALDVTAMLTTFLYQSSFDGGDVANAAMASKLGELFDEGVTDRALRETGAIEDIWKVTAPLKDTVSGDWGTDGGLNQTRKPAGNRGNGLELGSVKSVEANLMARLADSLAHQQEKMRMRSLERGFGSNAWAVSSEGTTDGSSLLAADGHLPLGIPSILYQVGLDTSVYGGGDVHQLGLVIPGIPVMPLGTNGKIAWSFTQLTGDITDWYREEIRLDENGEPKESLYQGEWKALERVEEAYEIAGVSLLGSEARTETLVRYKTFDGRWLTEIEGRPVVDEEEPGEGETVVRMHSGFVIPADTDGDEVITAISLDYVGFDVGDMMGTLEDFGRAKDVMEFREATRGLMMSSLNFTVSDGAGNIYYSAYQAVPCRGYLPKDDDNNWIPGADPRQLLDGTQYGGFTIPTQGRKVDELPGQSDPYACVVPFEETPQRMNPASNYVLTANNDPVGATFDNQVSNDPWYIGGPWNEGFRADTIDRELKKAIADNTADVAQMSKIQGNHDSRMGETFVPYLLETLTKAKDLAASEDALSAEEQRLVDLYQANQARFDAVATRLDGWKTRGYQAKSGVETFYDAATATDREDAVATMIFNAWFGAFQRYVFDDEGLDDQIWQTGYSVGRVRALGNFLAGRGAENPRGLASWNPATGESVFFDNLTTPEVETSAEGMLHGLEQALDFLSSENVKKGEGGFGTEDMSAWLWGMRHMVRLESLLLEYLADQPALGALVSNFSITTGKLPLAEDMAEDDPRRGLRWFPRHGDQFNVDAAHPGISGTEFSYTNGAVMRMVVALKDGEVSGVNIIPGGQSGLIRSPYFMDQAKLWLGNETVPLRFHLEDVVAGAEGRELYRAKK